MFDPHEEEYIGIAKDQDGIREDRVGPAFSDIVQVGLEMRKYRDFDSFRASSRTVGPKKPELNVEQEIRDRLGWSSTDDDVRYSLTTLLNRIAQAGITDPNSFLNIEEASRVSGLSERKLWKLIAQGKLVLSDTGTGKEGTLLFVPSLFRVVLENEQGDDHSLSTAEGVGREVVNMCRQIIQTQRDSVRRTDELIEVFKLQTRMFEGFCYEQRLVSDEMARLSSCVLDACESQRPLTWRSFFSLR